MIYLINKKFNLVFLLLCFYILVSEANSFENKIIYKVNNEIITSFDIKKEFRYLSLINPKIINLEKNEIFEVSKNSIIREKIKKIEILNHVKKIFIDEIFMNKLLENSYSKIGINNKNQLQDKLDEIGIEIEEFKEKLAIEALWNQLIFEKYNSKVKIDKKKIREEISAKKMQSVFLLSEIVFEIEDNKKYLQKYNIIQNDIKNKGFENAALIHSISESKNVGGNLGWINENSINQKLKNLVAKLNIGENTKPQVIPGGFLILKLNDVKKNEVSVNIEEEIKKLIKIKTNQQLNQYSSIYFNKIKKNIKIEKI